MMLPHWALVSHPWPPDAHSFSSGREEHRTRFQTRSQMYFISIQWTLHWIICMENSRHQNTYKVKLTLSTGNRVFIWRASALIAYLRSVCRFPGNLVDKHTCSSQACFHTHPDHHTPQDSPNIHPHLGQRKKTGPCSARLFHWLVATW